MSESKTYNFSNPKDFSEFFGFVSYLKEKNAIVEIKEVKQTRSSQQNRALHLFFTFCADSLNDCGFEFSYRGIKGTEIEIPWTGILFKEMVWKKIQMTLFDFESTTKLKTAEINQILDVLIRHFAIMGLSIHFPSKFDLMIEKFK